MGDFNPEMLLLARQYRGKNQSEVAKLAGLNQGYYSRIENGLLPGDPADETVRKLSAALRVPRDFFFQADRIYGLPISVHPMHRKRAEVGERVLQQLHAELNVRLVHLRKLLAAIELEQERPLPRIDVDDGGGPENVAAAIRLSWNLPPGPIANLTECAERAGALVVWCQFSANVDGVTLQSPELPPCVFLKSSVPADRMRYTLAHEIGHLVMHRVPTDDMENEAHAFARALLMPARDIKAHFVDGVTLEKLIRLKAYWKVSIQALLYRARELKFLSQYQSEYLWRRISALGWRTREPSDTDFPHEEPQVFQRLLEIHTKDLAYSREEIATALNVDEEDLSYLYGLHRTPERPGTRLRIVK